MSEPLPVISSAHDGWRSNLDHATPRGDRDHPLRKRHPWLGRARRHAQPGNGGSPRDERWWNDVADGAAHLHRPGAGIGCGHHLDRLAVYPRRRLLQLERMPEVRALPDRQRRPYLVEPGQPTGFHGELLRWPSGCPPVCQPWSWLVGSRSGRGRRERRPGRHPENGPGAAPRRRRTRTSSVPPIHSTCGPRAKIESSSRPPSIPRRMPERPGIAST